jgi:mannose-6-phosphate isomerase-like protein (cupin superfamily)
MNQRLRGIIGALSLVVGASACSKQEPAEKAKTAPEAPVTAGYEAAIAAHAMKPIFRPNGTAPAVYGPGDVYNFLATGEETNNSFFQFEAIVPRGGGPPAHIHSREEETFYVVSGSLEIVLGDSIYQAKAGDFVFIPRGTVHRFRNLGTDTAIQLVTFVPAGMERYFREVFPPVTDRKAAAPPITDELIQKLNEVAPKYGLEFPAAPEGGKK